MAQHNMRKQSSNNFGEVLARYRKFSGMNQTELAELLNTTKNTVLNWEKGKNFPDIISVQKIVNVLHIPPAELFSIDGEAVPDQRERVLLMRFRQLSDYSKRIVDEMVKTMLREETDARDAYLRTSFRVIEAPTTPVAAGDGCEFRETSPGYMYVKKSWAAQKADAVLRVSGHSMEPYYHDGDLVYVKYTEAADDGDDVICRIGSAGSAVIKRKRGTRLFSLNRELPFDDKSEDDEVRVIGKVLGIVGEDEKPAKEDIPTLDELFHDVIRQY